MHRILLTILASIVAILSAALLEDACGLGVLETPLTCLGNAVVGLNPPLTKFNATYFSQGWKTESTSTMDIQHLLPVKSPVLPFKARSRLLESRLMEASLESVPSTNLVPRNMVRGSSLPRPRGCRILYMS